ncbi:hypothetical protein LCGC14_0853200 [marine sediment metagenome]|uniref:Uncharacterized protein n=1 Tax=marine sediment metagenome TaxID=412755 RepID=A0A0F9SGQ6_9ZZZZ
MSDRLLDADEVENIGGDAYRKSRSSGQGIVMSQIAEHLAIRDAQDTKSYPLGVEDERKRIIQYLNQQWGDWGKNASRTLRYRIVKELILELSLKGVTDGS